MNLVVFLRPARFNILLAFDIFVFLEAIWRLSFFYLFIFFPAVTLPGNINEAGANDLPFSGYKAMALEL